MMHTNQGGVNVHFNKAKVLAYLHRQLEGVLVGGNGAEDLIISVTWGELKQEITIKGDDAMEKLVGKWVKRVKASDYGFTKDGWYQVGLEYTSAGYTLTNNKGESHGSYPSSDNTYFDFANPRSYNPNKEILLSAGDVVTIDAGIVKYNLMKYLSVQSKLDHLKNYQSYIKIIIGVLKSKYDFSRNFNAVLDYLDLNHYKAGLVLEDITIRTQCSIPQPVVYINGEAVGDRAIITQAMLDEEVANKVSPNEDDKLCNLSTLLGVLDDLGVRHEGKTHDGVWLINTCGKTLMCTDTWVTYLGCAEFLTLGDIKQLIVRYYPSSAKLVLKNKVDEVIVGNTCELLVNLMQALIDEGVPHNVSSNNTNSDIHIGLIGKQDWFEYKNNLISFYHDNGAPITVTKDNFDAIIQRTTRDSKLEPKQAPKEQPKTVPTTADNILEVLAYNGWRYDKVYTEFMNNQNERKCKWEGVNQPYIRITGEELCYQAYFNEQTKIATTNFDVFLAFLTSVAHLKELPVEVDYLSAVQSGWWVKATKTVECGFREASNRIYSNGITSGEYYQVVHLHYKQQNKPSCVEIVDNGSNTWFYGLDYFDWSTAVADKPSK